MRHHRFLTLALVGGLFFSVSAPIEAHPISNLQETEAAKVNLHDDDNGDDMPSQPKAERISTSTSVPVAMLAVTPEQVYTGASNDICATSISGESIVKTALQYLGVRYRSGASSPTGFDCSGFTSYVFKQQNIMLTRSSRTQYNEGEAVENIADLRAGDLVFFGGSRSSKSIGHVGIVTEVDPSGDSFKFIHASRQGIKVDDSKQQYYSRRYVGARRVLQ